jgi:hypothetical protein
MSKEAREEQLNAEIVQLARLVGDRSDSALQDFTDFQDNSRKGERDYLFKRIEEWHEENRSDHDDAQVYVSDLLAFLNLLRQEAEV